MHPLDTIIDDSHHCPRRTVARRRSSLDNSCLAAPDAFRQIMMDSCGSDDDDDHRRSGDGCRKGGRRSGHRERRLSWNSAVSKPTTFLAGPMTPSSRPKKVELDADFHHSHHSPKSNSCRGGSGGGSSGHAANLTNSPPIVSDAGEDDDDDSSNDDGNADDHSEEGSLDSDCDSFCDASFQEPANREYLRRDLGASCYWASTDTCMLGDLDDEDFDEVECVVDDMLRNEGLDGLSLDD